MTKIKFTALPLEFEASNRVSYESLGEVFSVHLYALRLNTKDYFNSQQKTFRDTLGYVYSVLLDLHGFILGYSPSGVCQTRSQISMEGKKGLKVTTFIKKGNSERGKTFVLGHEETHAAISIQRSSLLYPLIEKYSSKLLEPYKNTNDEEVKADIGGLTAVFLKYGQEGIAEIEKSERALESLKRQNFHYNTKLSEETTLLDLIAIAKQ